MEQVVAARTVAQARRWWMDSFRGDLTREEALKAWVHQDIRYPEIARRLGTTIGSVCGKVARLGIGKGPIQRSSLSLKRRYRITGYANLEHAKQRQTAEQLEYARIEATLAQEASEAKAWVEGQDLRPHHCRFVIGEPSHDRHCGLDRLPGLPYCRRHSERCGGPSSFAVAELDLAA